MQRKLIPFVVLLGLNFTSTYADKPNYLADKSGDSTQIAAKQALPNATLAGCSEPNEVTILDFNNVRARIYASGDMFWDKAISSPAYEIPKGSGNHSMFLASLWLGGTDVNGQLRIAAQRFAENGTDFYTGPLDTTGSADISPEECANWDKHFIITKAEVEQYASAWEAGEEPDIPKSIKDWPAHGDPSLGQSYYLAPFFDRNGNGFYDPESGDYPYYDLSSETECNRSRDREPKLFGDQTIWWVFNDKGNVHHETEADAIGVEIQAQVFAFATNDEINNMTFTNYRIINRSTFTLIDTYFGTNFDVDLGDATDDYVGCDVQRGLGYCYNGNACDADYGCSPPAIGIDFFEGPYQDSDGEDNPTGGCDASINGLNFGDGEIDNERWGMRRFVYYVNDACNTICDPDVGAGTQYYNYLKGLWKDGTQMLYGGNGHVSGCTSPFSCAPANFMFPGDTDPCGWGTGGIPQSEEWSEQAINAVPGDRRFVHSAGPFTLEPGAENDITVGIVWARSSSSDPFASVELVRQADDKAQALFDNCFRVLDGPDAPDITIQELDQELILFISNPNSNNANEDYAQVDPQIVEPGVDNKYRFQGYQIYQLADYTTSISDINNIEKARLVAQVDIKDDVVKLINKEYSDVLNYDVATLMVDGKNNGIRHSFKVTEDLFAIGDKRLVNHKDYYYVAVAYAHNQYQIGGVDANKKPYLASRRDGHGQSIASVRGIPHRIGPEEYGTISNSVYGDGPEITRNEGQGNGGHDMRLSQESINQIITFPWKSEDLTYQRRRGPIDVKVVDPLKVLGGKYAVKLFYDEADRVEISKIRVQPTVLTGINYFEVTSEVGALMNAGDKIEVEGSTYNDGVYTILKKDTTDTWIYVEETIPDTLSDGYINPGYKWLLLNGANHAETLYVSSQFVKEGSEQLIAGHGFSITLRQVTDPGPTYSIATDLTSQAMLATVVGVVNPSGTNGFISGTMSYNNNEHPWLTGVNDGDAPNAMNWILAGTAVDTPYVDYPLLDENEVFETILGGTWAPYALCSKDAHGPAFDFKSYNKSDITNLASINLVITSDKSKWTRSAVIEMQENPIYTKPLGSNVPKLNLRAHLSVDKNGKTVAQGSSSANYDGFETGMGWFPGYAINVETGERLNILFGEDSWVINGDDMIWNPTSDLSSPLGQQAIDAGIGQPGVRNIPFWAGGKHVIYVVGHNGDDTTNLEMSRGDMPAYDEGAYIRMVLDSAPSLERKQGVFKDVMWVGMPMLANGYSFERPSQIPTDVTIRLRVEKPYARNFGTSSWKSDFALNDDHPMYSFDMTEFATQTRELETAQSVLDDVRVVPNPYYAFSSYERSQVDNRVKITNLPVECTVSIYSIDGKLIRRFEREDHVITSIDWDLMNHASVPIASGVYLIHVDAPGIGETVVKWFGTLRPVDLDSF